MEDGVIYLKDTHFGTLSLASNLWAESTRSLGKPEEIGWEERMTTAEARNVSFVVNIIEHQEQEA